MVIISVQFDFRFARSLVALGMTYWKWIPAGVYPVLRYGAGMTIPKYGMMGGKMLKRVQNDKMRGRGVGFGRRSDLTRGLICRKHLAIGHSPKYHLRIDSVRRYVAVISTRNGCLQS